MAVFAEPGRGDTLGLETIESANPTAFVSVQHRLFRLEIAWLYRLWWHTKAYGTVLGIAVLTLGSLVVLFAHQRLRCWLDR